MTASSRSKKEHKKKTQKHNVIQDYPVSYHYSIPHRTNERDGALMILARSLCLFIASGMWFLAVSLA